MKKYYLSNDSLGLSKLPTYNPYGNVLNWNSFSIEEMDFENLKKYVSNFIEIDQEIAVFGFRSFGDPRIEIKISKQDIDLNVEYDDSVDLSYYESVFNNKVKIPMSEKRYNCVVKTMKLVSKLILEEEFENRYKKYIASTTLLEINSWHHQLNDEIFVEHLSSIKKISKEDFKTRINTKKQEHDEYLKKLYLELQELKQKFYDVETIKELNILYEDYFNIPMHGEQARECGRLIEKQNGTIYRKPVGTGFNF
jgi:hypothetical protein